jgi:hypothetical protein
MTDWLTDNFAPLLAGALAIIFLAWQVSCGRSALHPAAVTLNSSAVAGEAAIDLLEQAFEKELRELVENPTLSLPEKEAKFLEIKARYRPAIEAYEAFRGAWVAAARALDILSDIEQDGRDVDPRDAVSLIADCVKLQLELEKLVSLAVGGHDDKTDNVDCGPTSCPVR